jgi:hypothetical protein
LTLFSEPDFPVKEEAASGLRETTPALRSLSSASF